IIVPTRSSGQGCVRCFWRIFSQESGGWPWWKEARFRFQVESRIWPCRYDEKRGWNVRSTEPKNRQPQERESTRSAQFQAAMLALHPRAALVLQLQDALGNRAVQRLLRARSEALQGRLVAEMASSRSGPDMSRIPRELPAAGTLQTKLAI